MIKAITFDLWDTVIHDDSDEPKRSARGLRSKRAERRHALWEALDRNEPIDSGAVALACDVTDAAFNHVWHEQHITWKVAERLRVTIQGLGRVLPTDEFAALVKLHEEMEITVMPDPIDGIVDAVESLAARYPLAVVSDAIVSPGRCLRQWLEAHGIKRHFTGFAFSDEVGHSKPHRDMFASAAEQLGVALEDIVHIGDRDHNDVQGPHALGMKAILFTATRDRDKQHTRADAICEHARGLVEAVERVAAGAGSRA